MAECPPCKAAIDCTGFLYSLDKAVDLIIAGHITDPEAIDDFNALKEKMQKGFDRWVEKHVEF